MKNLNSNVQNNFDNVSNNQINYDLNNEKQNDSNDKIQNGPGKKIANDSKNALKGYMKAQSWILKTKDKRMIKKINSLIEKLNS